MPPKGRGGKKGLSEIAAHKASVLLACKDKQKADKEKDRLYATEVVARLHVKSRARPANGAAPVDHCGSAMWYAVPQTV